MDDTQAAAASPVAETDAPATDQTQQDKDLLDALDGEGSDDASETVVTDDNAQEPAPSAEETAAADLQTQPDPAAPQTPEPAAPASAAAAGAKKKDKAIRLTDEQAIALREIADSRAGLYRFQDAGGFYYAMMPDAPRQDDQSVGNLVKLGLAVIEPTGGHMGSVKVTPAGREYLKAVR